MTTRRQRAENNFRSIAKKRGWEILSPYERMSSKIFMRCAIGHTVYIQPHSFTEGKGCRFCAGKDPLIAELKFRFKMKEIGGKVIGKYKDSKTKISCICVQNHKCTPTPLNILRGQGICRICVGHDPGIAEKDFREYCDKIGIIVKGNYTNTSTPIDCICAMNHVCRLKPYNVKQGIIACKECVALRTSSSGERKIEEALDQLKIQYRKEFSLPTQKLRFDFQLFDLKIIIEADGDQHFKVGYRKRNKEDLKKSQARDCDKMFDAIIAGYKIIRIDHTLYKRPVEDFVNFLKPHLTPPVFGSPRIILSNPKMYEWMYDHFPRDFWTKHIASLE